MVEDKKLALITRPLHDALKIEGDLAQIGIESFIEPFLTISHYQNAAKIIRPYLSSCQSIVATSANAIRAVGYIKKPIITVGESSAQVAKEMGFEEVTHSEGNVAVLEKYIENYYSPKNGGLLYISGDHISKDFSPKGFKTMRVVVYNALPIQKISTKCRNYLKLKEFDYIFFFSKRTAQVFADLTSDFDFSQTVCCCISRQLTEPIIDLGFKEIIIMKKFDSESLIELIK